MKKKIVFLTVAIVLVAVVLVTVYFRFRSPQTLADVAGGQFMEPDQLIVVNGNNGDRRELKDKEKEEMLELLWTVKIQDIKNIDIMHGSSFIQFIKGDDWFNLSTHEGSSFRVNDPDHSDKMIVYHMEKEGGNKIREKMRLPY